MPAQASVRVPVRWRDLDLLGHLNQAVYHEYLEEARGALMASLGPDIRFPFVLARVELDYLSEVRRNHGEVEVVARVDRVGTKSLTVSHEVLLPDGTVAATGSSVFVAWDVDARGSRRADRRRARRAGGVMDDWVATPRRGHRRARPAGAGGAGGRVLALRRR